MFPALAEDRWGYHGIYLGATMTEDQIMHALGADKYVRNPKYDPWNNSSGCDKNPNQKICEQADFQKYGLRAIEFEEDQIGPSCDEQRPGHFSCVNPWMAGSIPDWNDHGHGVTKVEVFVRDGKVFSIDIMFDSMSVDDFFETAHKQFGPGWTVERESLYITDDPLRKTGITVDRITEKSKQNCLGQ